MVLPKLTRKQLQLIALALALALVLAAWLISRFITPAPPRTISMTSGALDGAAHQFGLKYQSFLKANGVTLELQTSNGSVQNLERLNAGTPVGFVQGGLGVLTLDPSNTLEETPLHSLAVIGYEPLWIFTHSPELAKQLSQGLGAIAGKKIAIGGQGSGTRKVALELLQLYGIDDKKATLSTEGGTKAADMLIAKELDAVLMIVAPQGAAVQKLLNHGGIQLVQIDHAEGLARRLPYLSLVTLKASSVSPERKLPPQDVTLLTTTANLVVRDDLHPALSYLLLEAAREIHQSPSLLNRPGDFPHPRATDFPLAEESQRYFKDGRPFLQRYLPFWLANFVQRLLLILVPLLAIAIPVLKAIPGLFNFKEKNRLYRRYAVLLEMEGSLRKRQLSKDQLHATELQLEQIEQDISKTKFTLEFADRVYTLRQHVDFVRGQIHKQQERPNT